MNVFLSAKLINSGTTLSVCQLAQHVIQPAQHVLVHSQTAASLVDLLYILNPQQTLVFKTVQQTNILKLFLTASALIAIQPAPHVLDLLVQTVFHALVTYS